MFGLDGSELAVIAVVALVVIGPKDMPRVMRMVGQWVAKARGMSRHVRAGFDTMMREAELEEMQKQWDAQNAAIIAATRIDADTPRLSYDTPEALAAEEAQMLPLAATETPAELTADASTSEVAAPESAEAAPAEPVHDTTARAA